MTDKPAAPQPTLEDWKIAGKVLGAHVAELAKLRAAPPLAAFKALAPEQISLVRNALSHYKKACSQSGTAFADNIDSVLALIAEAEKKENQND